MTRKEFRKKNKDKISEYNKGYYKKNRDKLLEKQNDYRERNRDEIIEKNIAKQKNDPLGHALKMLEYWERKVKTIIDSLERQIARNK